MHAPLPRVGGYRLCMHPSGDRSGSRLVMHPSRVCPMGRHAPPPYDWGQVGLGAGLSFAPLGRVRVRVRVERMGVGTCRASRNSQSWS